MRGKVAAPSNENPHQFGITMLESQGCADPIPVAFNTDQVKGTGCPFFDRTEVFQDPRRTILVPNHQVRISIVVQVSNSQCPPRMPVVEIVAFDLCQAEPALFVFPDQAGLQVLLPRFKKINVGVHMAIGDDHLHPAISIQIDEFSPPSDPRSSPVHQSILFGNLRELQATEPLVKGIVFFGKIGAKQIDVTVIVGIGSSHPHAGQRATVGTVAGRRQLGPIFESGFPAVDQQQVGMHVVATVQINQAILVKIGGDHTLGTKVFPLLLFIFSWLPAWEFYSGFFCFFDKLYKSLNLKAWGV